MYNTNSKSNIPINVHVYSYINNQLQFDWIFCMKYIIEKKSLLNFDYDITVFFVT